MDLIGSLKPENNKIIVQYKGKLDKPRLLLYLHKRGFLHEGARFKVTRHTKLFDANPPDYYRYICLVKP